MQDSAGMADNDAVRLNGILVGYIAKFALRIARSQKNR